MCSVEAWSDKHTALNKWIMLILGKAVYPANSFHLLKSPIVALWDDFPSHVALFMPAHTIYIVLISIHNELLLRKVLKCGSPLTDLQLGHYVCAQWNEIVKTWRSHLLPILIHKKSCSISIVSVLSSNVCVWLCFRVCWNAVNIKILKHAAVMHRTFKAQHCISLNRERLADHLFPSAPNWLCFPPALDPAYLGDIFSAPQMDLMFLARFTASRFSLCAPSFCISLIHSWSIHIFPSHYQWMFCLGFIHYSQISCLYRLVQFFCDNPLSSAYTVILYHLPSTYHILVTLCRYWLCMYSPSYLFFHVVVELCTQTSLETL